MRVCNRCRKAENPKGELRFTDSPEGVLCHECYKKYYEISRAFNEELGIVPTEELVVIVCPTCRGKHHAMHGNVCESCCGYGSVRIPANALPVYRPGKHKQLLTEENTNDKPSD